MQRLVPILAFGLIASAPPAEADIYSCVTRSGRTVLQSQSCKLGVIEPATRVKPADLPATPVSKEPTAVEPRAKTLEEVLQDVSAKR